MEINQWTEKVHKLAREQGWWQDKDHVAVGESCPALACNSKNLTPEARLAKHMLFVTEVAEASEEVRNKRPPIYTRKEMSKIGTETGASFSDKPEGEMIELADVVIRIMDYFGFMEWDLEKAIEMKHNYNVCRALRHGGKAI